MFRYNATQERTKKSPVLLYGTVMIILEQGLKHPYSKNGEKNLFHFARVKEYF